MTKLKLKLDDIRVTGFEVTPEADSAGTVMGADAVTIKTRCDGYDSCPNTCYEASCICRRV